MDSEENVHRLEGTSGDEKGGLILKKKPSVFKIPQPSLLGLDRLAAQKRREKEEAARKMSFNIDEEGSSEENSISGLPHGEKEGRKFRSPQEETPTYTGGLSKEARDRLIERLNSNKNKEKGVYASTKIKSDDREKNKDRDYYRERRRDREREHERNRKRERYKSSERDSERRDKTPKFKDEPRTPNLKLKDGTSKSSWDEDDEPGAVRRSAWDFPTPTAYKNRSADWSERSGRSNDKSEHSYREDYKSSTKGKYKMEDDTPRPTPAHRYNAWVKDRKKTGATPGLGKDNEPLKWDATVDRENWEEEQKRLDREWYNMDEGYDDEHNPFSSVSDEYTKKKEEQLEQRKKKRLSAQQRQINKDNELWERNRMLTSGMYGSILLHCECFNLTFRKCCCSDINVGYF